MVESDIEILLAEHDANAEILSLRAFKQQNIVNKVHVARDGAEALDYLFCTGGYVGRRAENPRLILLDLKLSKVDGIEVLQRIRSDPRTQFVPVVILTSSNEEYDIADAYEKGVNSYIIKPVDFEEFSEIVRQLAFYWLEVNRQPESRILASTS